MKEDDDPLADVGRRAELDGRIAAVADADNPYWTAVKVMDCAGEYLVTSVIASRLYQVWAALADRYALHPEDRPDALREMHRAANEWLAAGDTPAAREAYLDHWQYDVVGYERPPG